MNRALVCAFLVLLAGCTLPPERIPLKPLPEDGPPMSYADLMTRARLQAGAANDAFYINKWSDLEDAAKGLEQTARFLGKATEIPPKHKDSLPVEAGDLGKEAIRLRESAKNQDVKQTNDILQQINLKVREMRPDS